MRRLLYIIQKEFIQIFRNKSMLPIMFLMPLFQMMILVFAATFEVKQVDVAIIDFDGSSMSRKLVSQIDANDMFVIHNSPNTLDEAEKMMQAGKVDMVLCIPQGFDKKLTTHNNPDVQLLIDAIVGNSAQLGSSYLSTIINDFNKNILIAQGNNLQQPTIQTVPSFWYNAELNYKFYMAPGILVVLITIIGMLLGGMNLVREKELGTIEQINVTPIKKWQFITGKLLPFLLIGLFELGFGLTLAKLLFNIPIRGSLLLLFAMAAVYLVLVLSAALYVSTESQTQQQVTFVSFFMMVVFLLMSGLFTPVESMPQVAQTINYLNPLYYFVKIMRAVILKGATFIDIINEFFALLVYAISLFSLAILRYRKTS